MHKLYYDIIFVGYGERKILASLSQGGIINMVSELTRFTSVITIHGAESVDAANMYGTNHTNTIFVQHLSQDYNIHRFKVQTQPKPIIRYPIQLISFTFQPR